jgi:hypothetical protein
MGVGTDGLVQLFVKSGDCEQVQNLRFLGNLAILVLGNPSILITGSLRAHYKCEAETDD